jgi:hypothetical protein
VTFVVVVLQFLCYYPQKHIDLTNNEPKTALFKRFDFAGLFIFAGSSAAFLVSISWAGPVYGLLLRRKLKLNISNNHAQAGARRIFWLASSLVY